MADDGMNIDNGESLNEVRLLLNVFVVIAQWKDKLGNKLILEDPLGNRFNVSLHVCDNKAYFADGIVAIRSHYLIPLGAMVTLKYMGNNRFKFWIPMSREFQENELGYDRTPNVRLLPNQRGNIEISWTCKISDALATGRQALVVKVNVATKLFLGKTSFTVKLENGELQTWNLIWTSTNQCRVGHGWYEYCRNMKPKKDDELCFTKYDKDDYVEVKFNPK